MQLMVPPSPLEGADSPASFALKPASEFDFVADADDGSAMSPLARSDDSVGWVGVQLGDAPRCPSCVGHDLCLAARVARAGYRR
jgi:hypothetical protein